MRLVWATKLARYGGSTRFSEGRAGLFGAITARVEAQVVRLSLVYALIDEATQIRCEHLDAALEVWSYCDNSTRFIFGNVADTVLRAVRGS